MKYYMELKMKYKPKFKVGDRTLIIKAGFAKIPSFLTIKYVTDDNRYSGRNYYSFVNSESSCCCRDFDEIAIIVTNTSKLLYGVKNEV